MLQFTMDLPSNEEMRIFPVFTTELVTSTLEDDLTASSDSKLSRETLNMWDKAISFSTSGYPAPVSLS